MLMLPKLPGVFNPTRVRGKRQGSARAKQRWVARGPAGTGVEETRRLEPEVSETINEQAPGPAVHEEDRPSGGDGERREEGRGDDEPTEHHTPKFFFTSARDYARKVFPPTTVLWGDDERPILTNEHDVEIVGREGIGKSYLLLRLACGIAEPNETEDREFLGIPLRHSGPVALITAELSGAQLQRRLRQCCDTVPDRLHILDERDLGGLNLLKPGHVESLARELKWLGVVLVGFDPLSRLWAGEELNTDYNRLVRNLSLLRVEAGCGTVIVHHEGRGFAAGFGISRRGDGDASRGGTALPAGMRSIVRLERVRDGLVRLAHVKSNLGGQWVDRYLDLSEPWNPVVVEKPTGKKDAKRGNMEAILGILAEKGDWMSVAEIEKADGCPTAEKDTLRKYLERLVAEGHIEHNRKRGPQSGYRTKVR